MSIHRRRDSGAWEVTIQQPGRSPVRKSNRDWTRADAVHYEATHQARSIEAALDKWLEEYVPFLRCPDQYRNKAEALRPLLKGETLLDAPAVALKARKAWQHLTPTTVNRRLSILRRLCHLAFEEWGWLDQPIGKKIKLLSGENERHVYLTRAQVEDLRMHCTNPEAGDLILLAAFTGLRLSEMFRAHRRDVVNNALRLDARTKSSRPRMIPLHPRALPIALRLPLAITPALLKKQWYAARTACALEYVHWHDLRHTFASWLIQSGASLQVVKELMGHATIAMTMRYAHLAPDTTRNAVENL